MNSDIYLGVFGLIFAIAFLLILQKQVLNFRLRKAETFYLNSIGFKLLNSWTGRNEVETIYTGKKSRYYDTSLEMRELSDDTEIITYTPRYGRFLYVRFYVFNSVDEPRKLPRKVFITNGQHSFPVIQWRVLQEIGGILPDSQGRYDKEIVLPGKAKHVIALFDVSLEIYKRKNQYRISLSDDVATWSSEFFSPNLDEYAIHYIKKFLFSQRGRK